MTRSTPDLAAPHGLAKAPGTSWRDHLCVLLQVGAELEHALMVEYLYAAYSLGGDQVPARHRDQVARWQGAMLTVAREEMGHLVSVQNLLTLIGGAVTFRRRNVPFDTPYYPFPFHLGPLDADTMARFVYAEMPVQVPTDATAREKRIAAEVTRRVLSDTPHPHHVAQLYDEIVEIVSDPARIPDSVFDPSSYVRQASWEEWGKGYRPMKDLTNATLDAERRHGVDVDDIPASERPTTVIVSRMATRTDAVRELKRIGAQGEASHLERRDREARQQEPSHFERFVDVYQGLARVKGWSPVRDVPVNPTTRKAARKADATPIESAASRAWADLFNLRYRMALTWLPHVFRLAADPRAPDGGLRGLVVHRIFGEMYNMKSIAGILMRSPLTDDPSDARRAGPPFEMPDSLELPATEAGCWELHRRLLRESLELGVTLKGHALSDAAAYLAALHAADVRAVAWTEQVLGGLKSARKA